MEVIGGDNESSLEHADFELDRSRMESFQWSVLLLMHVIQLLT